MEYAPLQRREFAPEERSVGERRENKRSHSSAKRTNQRQHLRLAQARDRQRQSDRKTRENEEVGESAHACVLRARGGREGLNAGYITWSNSGSNHASSESKHNTNVAAALFTVSDGSTCRTLRPAYHKHTHTQSLAREHTHTRRHTGTHRDTDEQTDRQTHKQTPHQNSTPARSAQAVRRGTAKCS